MFLSEKENIIKLYNRKVFLVNTNGFAVTERYRRFSILFKGGHEKTMKTFKRLLACCLALTMLAGLTACEEEGGQSTLNPTQSTENTVATEDPDENAADDSGVKEITNDKYTPDGNAGKITYLCHYKFEGDQKGKEQCKVFTSDMYGGELEQISCTSLDIQEKLATLIASDASPDIAVKDAYLYPGNASKNLFEPLDDYIDMNSALWVDMAPVIESFAYKGKHYYYPHRITTSFALNYSQKTIEENDLDDPYELYVKGEWTWDAWRNMMTTFCDKDEGNMGFYATDTILTSLIATTGTPLIDVQPTGAILNNIADPNVTKAMSFYETLYRDGVSNGRELADWVPPDLWATNCDKLLFLGMEPEWTYIAATEKIQNPSGVDSDILDTPSDFRFVPFPRDPDADKYYQAYDTWGFVVPKGAKNIKGAIDMINCFRVYDTDPGIIAQVRADHVSPAPVTYTDGKYAGERKWVITWGEREYDMWREMCDPNKFTFLTEDAFGFNKDFWAQYAELIVAVAFEGESWTQRSSEFSPIVEATVADFRY